MAMSISEFRDALGLNLPSEPVFTSYLTPAELSKYNTLTTSGAVNPTGMTTDQLKALSASGTNPLQLIATSINKAARDNGAIGGSKDYLASHPELYSLQALTQNPALRAQIGISDNSWNAYQKAYGDYSTAQSTWASKWYSPKDSNIWTPMDWLAKQGITQDQLKNLSDAQLTQLAGQYDTYKNSKYSEGIDAFGDIIGGMAGAVGVLTGNPWIAGAMGGVGGGISGGPLGAVLGAAGGYFGTQSLVNSGGLQDILSNLTSGFGGGTTAAGSATGDVLTNNILSNAPYDSLVSSALSGTTPIYGLGTGALAAGQTLAGAAASAGAAGGIASTVNDIAQTGSTANDVLSGGSTTGSAVTGANGVLQSAGNTTAAGSGLTGVSTGLSSGDIAIGAGALGSTGAGVLANAAGSTSGGLLSGTTSTLGSTASSIMNSLFGSNGSTGLLGSGLSSSAMDLLSGVFGSMNASDLSKLQDAIIKQNQTLAAYMPNTSWRDTLMNHLNTIVTNPGQLISSGPYKDYLDYTTNALERKAVAEGYGGVGDSSNTKAMISSGLISNINDIISKDYATSVSALQPYFLAGTQGTTNLTNYSNSSLPNSVATSNLGSNQLLANGAAGLVKSIFNL